MNILIKSLYCGALLVVISIFSCFTTTEKKSATVWVLEEKLQNQNLSENEIAINYDPKAKNIEYVTLNKAGKIYWFQSFIEKLELKNLPMDEKVKLFHAIFDEIPSTQQKFYKTVSIGKNPKNIIFYLSTFTPSSKAPAEAKLIFEITGNFILTTTKATGKINFTVLSEMINSLNWFSNGIVTKNSNLVRAGYLFSKEQEAGIQSDTEISPAGRKGNLADLYLKSEKPNLELIEKLLVEAAAEAQTDIDKTFIALNTFEFNVYKNNIVESKKSLEKAKEFGKSITEESVRTVIDIDAPFMLKLLEEN